MQHLIDRKKSFEAIWLHFIYVIYMNFYNINCVSFPSKEIVGVASLQQRRVQFTAVTRDVQSKAKQTKSKQTKPMLWQVHFLIDDVVDKAFHELMNIIERISCYFRSHSYMIAYRSWYETNFMVNWIRNRAFWLANSKFHGVFVNLLTYI